MDVQPLQSDQGVAIGYAVVRQHLQCLSAGNRMHQDILALFLQAVNSANSGAADPDTKK